VPIYEYACNECEHTLDALQKMSDDPLVDCPACGKPELKRLVSAPRFRLKGAGWYETDFKKDGQRNLAKGDGDAAPVGDKSESSASPDSSKAGGDKAAGGKAAGEKGAAKSIDKSADPKPAPSKTAESKSTASKSE